MTSVPKMACLNLRKIVFLYTEQRIDLRISFYVKHNRCELIADHFKKRSVEYVFFLPFISILINSSAYKLH